MSEEWGAWIYHDGKGCPCVGKMVWVQVGADQYGDPSEHYGDWDDGWVEVSNDEAIGLASRDDHGWCGGDDFTYPIIRYRIRRPLGISILNAILTNIPAPVKQYEVTE